MLRHLACGLALAAAFATPALAQDDFDLADGLAERGWYDLAEETFTKLQNSASLSAEQRAEAKYGLARMLSRKARTEPDRKKKAALFDSAIAEIKDFVDKYPKHPRRPEALSSVGDLFQQKGKFLMSQGRVDPKAPEEAEKAFGMAESLFKDLIKTLKETPVARPDSEKDKAAMEKWLEYDQQMMFAKYNYGISLFQHADVYKDNPGKQGDMKRLLEEMLKFFETDFMWDYEQYLLAYDAFIHMGRANQLLAETSDGAKAEEYWKKCFTYIGKAKGLLTDKEARRNPAVIEVASEAILHEMKARMRYGDGRKGTSANKQYNEAARLAEELFKLFSKLDSDTAKAVRLEQGRAYCKAGKVDQGMKLLEALRKDPKNKDTWVENFAIDILGEYAGETNVRLAVESADNIFDRGPAWLFQAIGKYRRALRAIRKREDEQHIPHCWFQIGMAYFHLDRYHEAVAAFTKLEEPPVANLNPRIAGDGALRKLMALKKLKMLTKDPADDKAYNDFLNWATSKYPKQVGSSGSRQVAIDLEDQARKLAEADKHAEAAAKYLEATSKWEAITKDPTDPFYEEALFSVGFDHYRRALALGRSNVPSEAAKATEAYTKALESFQRHLSHVEKLPTKEPSIVKNAVGSVYFSCKAYLSKFVNKPEEALRVSTDLEKRFPTADPKFVIGIMSQRIDAKLDVGKIEEAEEDFRVLKAEYLKEGTGLEHYSRAIGLLAQAFEDAASKLDKEKDKELYDNFSVKAAGYYYDYFQVNPPDPSKDAAKLEVIAAKLFMAAQMRMEKAKAAGEKAAIDAAKQMFAQARDLYAQFRLSGIKLTDEQQLAIKRRESRCFLEVGNFAEAVKVFEDITQNDPAMRDGASWEDKADCYFAQGLAMEKGTERTTIIKKADGVFATLAARLMEANKTNEHFWRLMYKHAQCLWEIDYDQLNVFFKNMQLRGYSPTWDDSQWGFAIKFNELQKKLEEKLPPKKEEPKKEEKK